MSNANQFFGGVSIPPGAQFELLVPGTTLWKHPQPGVAYNALIRPIGAGGAGGCPFGSPGGAGGVTSFGALVSANGGSPANGPNGGNGGFGGGGAGANNSNAFNSPTGAPGGNGLDYTGGAGGAGFDLGQATPQFASPGLNAGGPFTATQGAANRSGWPNGGPISSLIGSQGALGGAPSLLFPWAQDFGQGGQGGIGFETTSNGTITENGGGGGSGRIGFLFTVALVANQVVVIGVGGVPGTPSGLGGIAGFAGKPGCIGLWYWPAR